MSEKPEGYPETPELDKAQAVQDQTQAAGEFIDWLREQGIQLCVPSEQGYYWVPQHESTRRLLGRWQGIDYDAMQREQAAVLEYVRKVQG